MRCSIGLDLALNERKEVGAASHGTHFFLATPYSLVHAVPVAPRCKVNWQLFEFIITNLHLIRLITDGGTDWAIVLFSLADRSTYV